MGKQKTALEKRGRVLKKGEKKETEKKKKRQRKKEETS